MLKVVEGGVDAVEHISVEFKRSYSLQGTAAPAGGLPPERRKRKVAGQAVRMAIAAVPNPYNEKQGQQARVNVATDVLEYEFSCKRISRGAYVVGRLIQEVFEPGAGLPGRAQSSFEPSIGGDRSRALEHRIASGADRAALVVAFEKRLGHKVGEIGVRFLRRVFEGATFRDLAGALASEKAITRQGDRFRALLEDLAADGFAG